MRDLFLFQNATLRQYPLLHHHHCWLNGTNFREQQVMFWAFVMWTAKKCGPCSLGVCQRQWSLLWRWGYCTLSSLKGLFIMLLCVVIQKWQERIICNVRISAGQRLIVINCIQNKSLFWHCVYSVRIMHIIENVCLHLDLCIWHCTWR